MKYVVLGLVLGCMSCVPKMKDHFVLRGTIPGLRDSSIVELFPERANNLSTRIVDGKFEFRGKLELPMLCMLRVHEGGRYWKTEFFLENGDLIFETPHVDSLPPMFRNEDVRKERNYTVRGSEAQDEWCQYQQATIPVRHTIEVAKEEAQTQGTAENYRRLYSAQEVLAKMARNFIKSQRNLAVNLQVAEVFDRMPFTYDEAYVDGVLALFADCRDTCEILREFRTKWEKARQFVQGRALKDAKLETPDGKNAQLLDLLNKNGYTFIDLWASWCGSCRMENPNVKALYNKYKDRVKFVSVAVSDREEAWQQAMKEEGMPWEQFRDEGELLEAMRDLYNTTSIPSLFLISPDGRIVYKGSRSGDLETQLENIFNR